MTAKEILDRASGAFNADRVFGPAHTENGVTVIPAASIRGGGGGGGGSRGEGADADSGDGGGFGIAARPAGALIIEGNNVRWKVPFDLNKVIVGGQVVGVAFFFFGWLTARSTARAAVTIARLRLKGR